jgi:hypothetical protein
VACGSPDVEAVAAYATALVRRLEAEIMLTLRSQKLAQGQPNAVLLLCSAVELGCERFG